MGANQIVYQRRPRRKQRASAALAPSPWWAGEISTGRVRHFPPPADHTPMVRCRSRHKQCGKFYPGYYVEGCECEDCYQNFLLAQEHRWRDEQRRRPDGTLEDDDDCATPATESSPSAAAIAALGDVGGELPESLSEPLLSEDEEDLRGEVIEHFIRTAFAL